MRRPPGILGAAFGAMVFGALLASVSAQRGAAPVPAPISPLLRDYQPVTAERLKNPEDQGKGQMAKGKG